MGESSARLLATSLCSGPDGAACLRSVVLEAAAEVVALRWPRLADSSFVYG